MRTLEVRGQGAEFLHSRVGRWFKGNGRWEGGLGKCTELYEKPVRGLKLVKDAPDNKMFLPPPASVICTVFSFAQVYVFRGFMIFKINI